jgi:hypothetical protein
LVDGLEVVHGKNAGLDGKQNLDMARYREIWRNEGPNGGRLREIYLSGRLRTRE